MAKSKKTFGYHESDYDVMSFVEEALLACEHSNEPHKWSLDGIWVTVYPENYAIRRVRIQSNTDNPRADKLRELAYNLVTTLLSETTNNDACDVVIREKSAHHDDLPFGTIVVEATIEDELT